MAKITPVVIGDSGEAAKDKINEALKSVTVNPTTMTGDGTVASPLSAIPTGIVEPVDSLEYVPDLAAAPAWKEGLSFYDPIKKALSYYNDSSEITVNISQEVLFRVENQTGATLPNGTVIAPDGVTIITKANAYNKDKSRIIAVLTESIPNGATGYATKIGQVGGLDTSMFSPGQIVYLGSDGDFVAGTPNDGGYVVIIGVVDVVSATEGIITVDTTTSDLTVEVTDTNGFPPDQRDNTIMAVNNNTRTFTIQAVTGTDFHYYVLGDKFEQTAPTSVVFPNTEGIYWVYFDTEGIKITFNPQTPEKTDIVTKYAFVSYFYWNAVDQRVEFDLFDERHGISMSPATHIYLHLTRGAQYVSGYSIGNVITEGDGDLDTSAQFSMTSGVFFDEDLSHESAFFAVGDTMDVLYLEGNSLNRAGTIAGFAMLTTGTGRLAYNLNTAGVWSVEEIGENDYGLVHIFGVNGQDKQFVSVMGQGDYPSLSAARTAAPVEISNIVLGFEAEEIIPIATFIMQTRNSYDNGVKSRFREDGDGNDFIDWRTSEISGGANPSSHSNLTDVDFAAPGITQGHINDQTQNIAGAKTFDNEFTTVERSKVTLKQITYAIVITFNLPDSDQQQVSVVTGAMTINAANIADGQTGTISYLMDATGGYAITLGSGTWVPLNGADITTANEAAKKYFISFIVEDSIIYYNIQNT